MALCCCIEQAGQSDKNEVKTETQSALSFSNRSRYENKMTCKPSTLVDPTQEILTLYPLAELSPANRPSIFSKSHQIYPTSSSAEILLIRSDLLPVTCLMNHY